MTAAIPPAERPDDERQPQAGDELGEDVLAEQRRAEPVAVLRRRRDGELAAVLERRMLGERGPTIANSSMPRVIAEPEDELLVPEGEVEQPRAGRT